MVIALAALLCVSCSAGGIFVVSIEQVSPGEANIVVRISNGDRQIRWLSHVRKVISPSVMMMGRNCRTAGAKEAQPLSPRGVTYGTETYECLTTDEDNAS